MSQHPEIQEVLSFWFGNLDEQGYADAEHVGRWWTKNPAFDDEVRERFADLRRSVLAGEHEAWLESAEGTLAFVIVLDQFSRNMYRDAPDMYSGDARALEVCMNALNEGVDLELGPELRPFLYMPLMHAEEVSAQKRCVELFESFGSALGSDAPERLRGQTSYAVTHCEIVEQFGRFPHRNEILGREHTAEEQQFLDAGGPTF